MRILGAALAGLVVGACASIGGGSDGDGAERQRASALTPSAAEQCVEDALEDAGFVVSDGDNDDGRLEGVRPRDEILGIPTSDDFDRIQARVEARGTGSTIRLTLSTWDGNEEESLSREVRRDADRVLESCR